MNAKLERNRHLNYFNRCTIQHLQLWHTWYKNVLQLNAIQYKLHKKIDII